jgi:hypothetical protein
MGETDEFQNEISLSPSKTELSAGVCAMSMSMPFIAVGNKELGKAGRTSSLIFSECHQAMKAREKGGGGVESASVPVLEKSWGVRGHRSFLRGHFSFCRRGQGHGGQNGH